MAKLTCIGGSTAADVASFFDNLEIRIRMASLYSWVGHRSRELLVHAHRVIQPTNPGRSVVIFPGEWATGSGSDLRATALAREVLDLLPRA